MPYVTIHDLACSSLPNPPLREGLALTVSSWMFFLQRATWLLLLLRFCLSSNVTWPERLSFSHHLPQAALPPHSSSRSLILFYFFHKVSLPTALLYISVFMTVCCVTLELSLKIARRATSLNYKNMPRPVPGMHVYFPWFFNCRIIAL